jgi:hypothetical protein
MTQQDAIHRLMLSLSIAVLICLLLWLAAQVQDVQDQLDQIDAHYRATEPTRTGGVG